MTSTHSMDDISHVENHLAEIEDRLITHYAPAIPAQRVRDCMHSEAARFASAPVQVFVPVLVERAVRARLG